MADIRQLISQKVQKFGAKMFQNILYYFDQWYNQIYLDVIQKKDFQVKTYLTSNVKEKLEFIKIAHEVKNFSSFVVLMDFLKQFYLIQFSSNIEIPHTNYVCDAQISIEFFITKENFLKILVKFVCLEENYPNLLDAEQQKINKQAQIRYKQTFTDLQFTPNIAEKRINEFKQNEKYYPQMHEQQFKTMNSRQIAEQINAFANILRLEAFNPIQRQQCAECIVKLHSILANGSKIDGQNIQALDQLVQEIKHSDLYQHEEKIQISDRIIQEFIQLSNYNTVEKQIETLGFIAGYKRGDQFIGDQLIVPKQSGSYDSCHIFDEMDIPKFLEQADRLLLAWIHTHPKHGQFMSAVDMHNQYLYQSNTSKQMNFLAIIYSPNSSQKIMGYQLTHQGLQEIGSCQKVGFHEDHQVNYSRLIKQVNYDSLAICDPDMKIQVFDLRHEKYQSQGGKKKDLGNYRQVALKEQPNRQRFQEDEQMETVQESHWPLQQHQINKQQNIFSNVPLTHNSNVNTSNAQGVIDIDKQLYKGNFHLQDGRISNNKQEY